MCMLKKEKKKQLLITIKVKRLETEEKTNSAILCYNNLKSM